MKYSLVLTLCAVLSFSLPHAVHAHNGAVAIAAPVERIAIDGDLSDWPEGMRTYPVARTIGGDSPRGESDFRASFRLGYSVAEDALFVAVEVEDDSAVIEGQTGIQHDGCEIYFDPEHGEESSSVLQPRIWGRERKVAYNGDDAGWKQIELAVARLEGGVVYEWRVDRAGLFQAPSALYPGRSFGLDVVVYDRDEDGTFTTMAWGAGPSKYREEDAHSRGDAILAESETGRIKGQVGWLDRAAGGWLPPFRVRLWDAMRPEMWSQLKTNLRGEYGAELPTGRYRLEVVEDTTHKEVEVDIREGVEEEVEPILIAPRPIGRRVKAGEGRTLEAGAGMRRGLWKGFTVEDGLPSNVVFDIFQDDKGYLWIGTRGGLCRYDGAHFTTFTTEDGLPDNRIWAITQDSHGDLWLGSCDNVTLGSGGGLTRYDGQYFTSFSTADGLADNWVRSLAEDRDGNLWIGTLRGGLSRYDGRAILNFPIDAGLPGLDIWRILMDPQGRLWFRSWNGASRLEGERFVPFELPGELAKRFEGYPALWDSKGKLWLTQTSNQRQQPNLGVARYDGEELVTFSRENGLVSNRVSHLLEDHQGNFWFADSRSEGVSRYDGEEFRRFSLEEMLSWTVRSIFQDREGHVWVGSYGRGISRYDGNQLTIPVIADTLAAITSIAQDRAGNIWVGSWGGGVRWNDGIGDHNLTTEDGLVDNRVKMVRRDSRGRMWICTWGGVSYYDDGRLVSFSLEQLVGRSGDYTVTSVIEDRQGNIWLGTFGVGAVRYDGERFVTFTEADGLGRNDVMDMAMDQQGHLWFATQGGVSRYDGRVFQTFTVDDGLPVNGVASILEDRQGNIWLGPSTGGVVRYDGTEFRPYYQEGLSDGTVGAILEDQEGILWFATSYGGVVRYDGSVFQRFSDRDGLPTNWVRDLLEDSQGNVWVATWKGVMRFPPTTTPPSIHITRIEGDRHYDPDEEIRLPTTQRNVSFEFQGISFKTRPQQMVYRYRLEGYEDQWSQTRNNRAEYENLPPGEYAFQVQAVDRDLNYSEEPASVDIEVFHQPIASSIGLDGIHIQDIFASFYQTYAEHPVGSVRVFNKDPSPLDATLRFYLPELMKRPAEKKLRLAPGFSQRIDLQVTLGEELLAAEGSRLLEAEIELSCRVGEQTVSIKETASVTVHGRGALVWDSLGRAAAFVTPEDGAITQWARGLLKSYGPQVRRRRVDGHIPMAMLLFEALNVHGIRYAQDASTPYSQVRTDRAAVDNIQYPAELLQSRMGDCDDCTVLYCSLLENLNIATALVDAPGHILMMFDSGVTEENAFGFSLPDRQYVERDGRFWIPIEVTKLGEGSFLEAWELGARTCRRLAEAGQLQITDVRDAWAEFAYALPDDMESVEAPDGEALESAWLASMQGLREWRESYVEQRYITPLVENRLDHQQRLALAKTRIESEEYNDAISHLLPLLDSEIEAEALYLIGYSYAGKDDLGKAVRYIEKAVEADPGNKEYRRSLEVLKGALAE